VLGVESDPNGNDNFDGLTGFMCVHRYNSSFLLLFSVLVKVEWNFIQT
jgi:hypothetical protein